MVVRGLGRMGASPELSGIHMVGTYKKWAVRGTHCTCRARAALPFRSLQGIEQQ